MCSTAAAPMASIPPDEAAKNGHRNDPTVGRVNNGSFGPCPASVLEEQGRWQRLYLGQPDVIYFHSLQPGLVNAGDVSKISLVDNAIPTAPNQERQPRSSSTPPWLLDTIRTPPTRERTPLQSNFDSLHGELSKLSAAVSQFAAVMGLQTTETLVTSSASAAPTQFRSPGTTASRSYMGAAASSSVSSFHSPSDASASAYVAPRVFDKMLTPSSGFENCSAHPNKIQSSCVQGGRTNLREQNLYYSLEQAAPETVFDVYDDKSDACSNEFIPMFTDTPEHVTVEKEKSESHQASECFSKPTFSPQRPTASTVCVFCLTNEQNTDNEPCGNHVKPQQIDNQQLNMLMAEAERKEWDPGTLKTIRFTSTPELLAKSFHKASENPSSEQPKCFSKETELTSACLYIISDVGDFTLELPQDDEKLRHAIEQQKNEDQHPIYDDDKTKGDSNVSVDVCATIPEQQPYEDTQQGSGQSPKCFSMPIFSPETPTVGINIDQLLKCPCEASECRTWDEEYQGDDNSLWEKSVCRTATWHYISLFPWDPGASLPLMSSKAQHSSYALQPAIDATIPAGSSATRFSGCKCLTFWVQNNSYALWKSEIGMPTYMSWDPGVLNILDMRPDKYTVPNSAQFMQQTTELSFLSLTTCIQYVAPKGTSSVRHATCFRLRRAAHLIQDNYLGSLYCKSVLKTSYVWDPGVNKSLYDCLDILTVWTEFDKPLSCTHIPDLAVWRNQSVGSGGCYIWDPGTMLLSYKCKWWLLYAEEKINWLTETKSYGVALWLVHFLPP